MDSKQIFETASWTRFCVRSEVTSQDEFFRNVLDVLGRDPNQTYGWSALRLEYLKDLHDRGVISMVCRVTAMTDDAA